MHNWACVINWNEWKLTKRCRGWSQVHLEPNALGLFDANLLLFKLIKYHNLIIHKNLSLFSLSKNSFIAFVPDWRRRSRSGSSGSRSCAPSQSRTGASDSDPEFQPVQPVFQEHLVDHVLVDPVVLSWWNFSSVRAFQVLILLDAFRCVRGCRTPTVTFDLDFGEPWRPQMAASKMNSGVELRWLENLLEMIKPLDRPKKVSHWLIKTWNVSVPKYKNTFTWPSILTIQALIYSFCSGINCTYLGPHCFIWFAFDFLKIGHPQPLFVYFRSFSNNVNITFTII